jgi:hypothetical protein
MRQRQQNECSGSDGDAEPTLNSVIMVCNHGLHVSLGLLDRQTPAKLLGDKVALQIKAG